MWRYERDGCRETRRAARLDEELVARVRSVMEEFPTYGYRRVWAILKHREGVVVNRKAVYRVMRLKRWTVHNRKKTARPRVQRSVSQAGQSNERWATDITHIHCGVLSCPPEN